MEEMHCCSDLYGLKGSSPLSLVSFYILVTTSCFHVAFDYSTLRSFPSQPPLDGSTSCISSIVLKHVSIALQLLFQVKEQTKTVFSKS